MTNSPRKAPSAPLPVRGQGPTTPDPFNGRLKLSQGPSWPPVLTFSDHEDPVLAVGKWNGVRFSEADLRELVDTYNPDAQPAPVKFGHEDKGPARGWVRKLRLGDYTPKGQTKPRKAIFATLAMEPGQSPEKGTRWMKSIEAWPRDHGNNPTPGKLHFKGLALLGAESPACPNLGALEFSDATPSEVEDVVFTLADETPNPGGNQPPSPEGGAAMELTPEQKAALAEAEAIKRRNQELEVQLANQAKAADQAAVAGQLDALVQEKKLTPAQRKVLEPVALALDASTATIALSDGKSTSLRGALFEILKGLKGHGLQDSLNLGDAPEMKGKADKKAFAAAVQKYKDAGKSPAEALKCASKDFADDTDAQA